MDLGGDWSGGNGASFGAASGNLAGTGANSGLSGTDFLSGEINIDKGLQFFGERIPEIESIDPGGGIGFAITTVHRAAGGEVTITWASSPGARYSIESASDLNEWLEVEDGVLSEGAETSFTDPAPADAAVQYYRVRRE